MSALWKLIKWSSVLVFFGILSGLTLIIGAYLYFVHDLPKLTNLSDYRPPIVSEVFDKEGHKVGEFWIERRILLPYTEIPQQMVQAIIASEDDRFFEHSGIDYLGILRAAIENLRAGHVVQGGSTITQQITKSLLLSRERTYGRKIKEAILAKQIEENFSKEEILYLYLTQTYFGNRAYGVRAAAENYFHKPLQELKLEEVALLAALPKAPSRFSPLVNPERALERQHYVIDRMTEEGYIAADEAELAKRTPMTIYKAGLDKDYNLHAAPWFTEHIRRIIIEKYGADLLYQGGLKIYTTLDLGKQSVAQTALRAGVRALDKRQGYKGPIDHVDPVQIPTTCAALATENDEFNTPIALNAAAAALAPRAISLKPDTLYPAVITEINTQSKELHVCHGTTTGVIRHSDYQWARERNLQTPGWEGVDYVSDPKARFKVGDVIEVAVKEAKGDESTGLYLTLEQTPEVESSLFSYDPISGDVLAMVGGYDPRKSEFNRAVQAFRQPGSAFKPLVYTGAIMKGYTPDTVVNDAPISFNAGNGKIWSPKNYGGKYFGPTPLRKALARSLNVVSVRIITDIGTDFVTAICRLLGITTPIERYYPMALGANDVHLSELARAYGIFATGGILPDTAFIRRIEDAKGKLLEATKPKEIPSFTTYFAAEENAAPATPTTQAPLYDPNPGQVPDLANESELYSPLLYTHGQETIAAENLDLNPYERMLLYGRHIPPGYTLNPKVAYTMADLLQGVVQFGTAVRAKELERPAAGKTGTTNDESDAWFMGFVPQLVTGVWVGFDSRKSIGAKETGGKAALPIWMTYMKQVLQGVEVAEFVTPPQAMSSYYDATRIKLLSLPWMRAAHASDDMHILSAPSDGVSPFTGEAGTSSGYRGTHSVEEDNFFSTDF